MRISHYIIMDIAITLKELIIFLIAAGIIVLIVYLIILISNRNKTIKLTNNILADVEIITKTAAKRTEDIDGIVDDIAGAVGVVTKNLKGNVNLVKVGTSIVNLVTIIRGVVKKNTEKKEVAAEQSASKGAKESDKIKAEKKK